MNHFMTDRQRSDIMPGKMRECDGCHKIMRSDNLKNHTRKCNGLNQNLNVSNENIRYPFADNSSKMSKSINPKISALVDAIVNEEPISKDPDGSSTSKDPDDNDSGIEPMDMTARQFGDDDEDEDEEWETDSGANDSESGSESGYASETASEEGAEAQEAPPRPVSPPVPCTEAEGRRRVRRTLLWEGPHDEIVRLVPEHGRIVDLVWWPDSYPRELLEDLYDSYL